MAFDEIIQKPTMPFRRPHEPIRRFRQNSVHKHGQPCRADAGARVIRRFKINADNSHVERDLPLLSSCYRLRGKPNGPPLPLLLLMSGKHLGKGIITRHRQFSAEPLGEACGLRAVQPTKDAVAKQTTWPEQRWVEVARRTVDRADDLQTEKVSQH